MEGYLGYALQAGVQGFQSGFNMAQKKTEMEWQKKQKKKLEEAEAKLTEEATLYNSVVSQAGADNFFSEDEIMKINTTYLALGYRTQESLKGAHNALLTMDKAAFDREMKYFDGTIELLKGGLLDPKDASAAFEYGRNNWATSDKVKSLYEAADNIYAKTHGKMLEEKTWERVGKLPTEAKVPFLEQEGIEMPEVAPEAPTMADEKSAITLLKTFINATPEQFEAQKSRIEQRTGLDLSVYTQDILKETGSEMYNLYNTPEEVMSNVKAPTGLTVIPKRDTKTGKYYGSFSKETGITPEGEVSPGEKSAWNMASEIMFGSSDWVTGISKPGIISMDISNKLNMGQPLTEEEIAEVRNSWNTIKIKVPSAAKSIIESQLKRYGISLEAPPEPEVLLDIKKKSFLQSDKKYYGGLSVEELYQLADKENDKKAYEELKKRGLIK